MSMFELQFQALACEKHEFQDPKPEFQDPKPEFQDPKPEFHDPKPEFQDLKPEFQDRQHEFQDRCLHFRIGRLSRGLELSKFRRLDFVIGLPGFRELPDPA